MINGPTTLLNFNIDFYFKQETNGSPDRQVKEQPSPSAANMTEEELLVAIRKQVEYYFSKENLQQDAYLTSQMDANMSVPLNIVLTVSDYHKKYCLNSFHSFHFVLFT